MPGCPGEWCWWARWARGSPQRGWRLPRGVCAVQVPGLCSLYPAPAQGALPRRFPTLLRLQFGIAGLRTVPISAFATQTFTSKIIGRAQETTGLRDAFVWKWWRAGVNSKEALSRGRKSQNLLWEDGSERREGAGQKRGKLCPQKRDFTLPTPRHLHPRWAQENTGSGIDTFLWVWEQSRRISRHTRPFSGQRDEPFPRLEVRTAQSNKFRHKTGTLMRGASSCIK